MAFLPAKEIDERWGISPHRVTVLCKTGRINKAQLVGSYWIIPEDTANDIYLRQMPVHLSGRVK